MQIEGLCDPGYFDDEKSCIAGSFTIPYRSNSVQYMDSFNLAVILDKTALLWDSTYSSFFMSFSVNKLGSLKNDGWYCIALAKEEGKNDTFNILLFSRGGKTIFTICIFFNNGFHNCYSVSPVLVWVGVWSNF